MTKIQSIAAKCIVAAFGILIFFIISINAASQQNIVGPAGSGQFGETVTALPNGNFGITDRFYDAPGPITDVGAVYLYEGATGTLINVITGSATNNSIGEGGITVLTNGNFVIVSRFWDNGGTSDVGAITFCNGTTGCSGTVSAANSLVGTTINDIIGNTSGTLAPNITALPNGNYVVNSDSWDNTVGPVANVGASTFCSGTSGCVGTINSANSLTSITVNSSVGLGGTTALSNGNYVVRSQNWDNGATTNVGAVTWCSGVSGCVGNVTSANSLLGTTIDDIIGNDGVTGLPNGNYVVSSDAWNSGVANGGAVTWCNGTSGCTGFVTTTNSLIGSTVNSSVGLGGSTALPNSNYVVRSLNFDIAGQSDVGAVTLCNGTTNSCANVIVSTTNSLVGGTTNDHLGDGGITVLSNGNFVVSSPSHYLFDNGRVTLCSGVSGCIGSGYLSDTIGNNFDNVGSSGVTALTNGNYLINSPSYDSGFANVGAITYSPGNGTFISASQGVVGGSINNGGSLKPAFDYFNEKLIVGRPAENIVSIFNPTYTSVVDGNWSASATWNYGAFTQTHDVYVPNGRTVNLDVIDIVSSLRVDCTGGITGASSSAYIITNIRKDFCSAGTFTYPVGTANGYSPVNSNVTSLVGSSSLTISATETVHPNLEATNSLKRFWSLTETGDLTTDLTFNYLDPTDISCCEATYKLYRVTGGIPTAITPFTLNTGANTISTTGITTFSDWAVGNLVPLVANVTIGGRVTAANGAGLKNVIVNLTDSDGTTRTTRTSSFGYYHFEDVEVGATYTVNVAAKRFTFSNPTQVITVKDNIADLNFMGEY